MTGIEFGLGRFADRRLEKGGPFCTRRLLAGQARVFAGLPERGRGRFSSRGFCAILR
jgi:hypothetical protein